MWEVETYHVSCEYQLSHVCSVVLIWNPGVRGVGPWIYQGDIDSLPGVHRIVNLIYSVKIPLNSKQELFAASSQASQIKYIYFFACN